jgi:hypothetical protein
VTGTAPLLLQRQARFAAETAPVCCQRPAPGWSALRQRRKRQHQNKTSYERKTKNKTVPARGMAQPPVGQPCNGGTQIEVLQESE